MISIALTDLHRQLASQSASKLTEVYADSDRSVRRGRGSYAGKLGEIVVAEMFGWKHIDTYDADFEAILPGKGSRFVDVKTAWRGVTPRPIHNANVAACNTKQKCDGYLFCSTVADRLLYIVGYMPKDEFYGRAVFYRKGEVEPGTTYEFKCDTYSLEYSALRPVNRRSRNVANRTDAEAT